jgi:hypothetical protein
VSGTSLRCSYRGDPWLDRLHPALAGLAITIGLMVVTRCARPAVELAITTGLMVVTRCARPAVELAITTGGSLDYSTSVYREGPGR